MTALDELRAEDDRFYAMMGRCIGGWARIEVNLFKLFEVALGAPEELCGVIFWAIPSFSMRISYTSSLVAECLLRPDLPASKQHKTAMAVLWDDLRGELISEYKFRNILAHQHIPQNTVCPIIADGVEQFAILHTRVDHIFANPLDKSQKFRPVTIDKIRSAIAKADRLDIRLQSFTDSFLRERLAKFSRKDVLRS